MLAGLVEVVDEDWRTGALPLLTIRRQRWLTRTRFLCRGVCLQVLVQQLQEELQEKFGRQASCIVAVIFLDGIVRDQIVRCPLDGVRGEALKALLAYRAEQ